MRPGCDTFLHDMAKLYEVVIFTAAMQDVLLALKCLIVCGLGVGSNRPGQVHYLPFISLTRFTLWYGLCKGSQ